MKPNKAIFTIVTKSYLAYARVMAKELRARHLEVPFYVFLADHPDGFFQPEQEPFTIIPLEDIFSLDLMSTMPGYYTAYEFCNALKPFAHLYLATIIQAESWFYLDSDIFVCGSLNPLFEELEDCSILLTSHILRPVELKLAEPFEVNFLRAGIYNGGFVGLKRTTVAIDFLRWWQERLVWYCLSGGPGLEADQSWLNFVPMLFPEVKVLKQLEVNVAYWNFHERELELDANNIVRVAGKPIPFLHFSGWNWDDPGIVSKHASPVLGNSARAWNWLRDTYRQRLLDETVQITSLWPYSFAKTGAGEEITPAMRRKYLVYCQEQSAQSPEFTVFSNPELFSDPPISSGPISLKMASRNFLGALLRALGWRN